MAALAEAFPDLGAAPDSASLSRFARVLASEDGAALLKWLQWKFYGRAMPPGTDTDHLNHLEGSRYLLSYLMAMKELGR